MKNQAVQYLDWARQVLQTEIQALQEVAADLDDNFSQAVEVIKKCPGRIVVMGIGKSGHIGRKIAATLASTGTPAFFVHPAEAAHGDLGMVVDGDVVLALSNSGESDEVTAILPAIKRKEVKLVCITGKPHSTMGRYADIHITCAVSAEACPLGLAPTSSSTAMLALGDALAVALLRAREFTLDDFALSHPAGSLGKRLLLRVRDIMHTGEALPFVLEGTSLKNGIIRMSATGLGMLAIVDLENRIKGIFTDGDLRRLFQQRDDFTGLHMDEVMHLSPQTISADQLATEALKQMQQTKVSGLLVVDDEKRLVGALNMHDLLKARII
ncbi:KpsF/GutQ family sugar-phosphate isomerase [Neisseria sp. S1]|uniref:KpsF/GutQ family sugar-phosphate isomerase n=1 Tax=Neisseria sp. S1 TaxID=3318354 RepID=UPI003A89B5A1